jgi:hypothetical protein
MKLQYLTKGEFYIIGIVILLLNYADLITTIIGLSLGAVELNSFFSYTTFYFISKLLVVTFFVLLMNYLFNRTYYFKLGAEISIVTMLFVFSVVVVNNILVIISQLQTVLI